MEGFSPLAQEALGWYVYLLVDPRSTEVFYIGKGRANRAFAHEASAVAATDHPGLQNEKSKRINEILAAGETVTTLILRHGIATENQAYEVESAAIDLASRLNPGTLLNVVLGHHHVARGLMPAKEIEVLHAAAPAPLLDVPVMLVSLQQLWDPTLTQDDLREVTCGWWKATGKRRDQSKYIFGIHNGVVRSIYRPINWRPRVEGDRGWVDDIGGSPRWGCMGESAPEMSKYLLTSVKRFLTSAQWSHRYVEPEVSS